ncbi:radical SAM protein [Nitrosomonas sp. sh817]|uniref:radical SAM protein n=1 Tax=Nitrosomonas sp. sh817 TaxID=3070658 RepID=UPI0027DBD5EA|nr:radical SAM protein [Nitrosomonas sp. sh817]WMJ09808.1 radical SAM protein [Nitrosomonas sp. sh817]
MQTTSKLLNTADHSRDSAGLTYVYPVISRRAGGVSIGINLNPNNACNWRCVYCQVPDLKRGSAPKIDLDKLEAELRFFLNKLIHGDFMARHVPPETRKIKDIALSGNGEPTSAKEFDRIIELIGHIKQDFVLPVDLKTVLITNGSLIHRVNVQAGLQRMAALNGEIWFKFDRASTGERRRINNTTISLKRIQDNLMIAASLCSTWLQTCVFQIDGMPPADEEVSSYLVFIRQLLDRQIPIQGVLLYGLARPSLQPEASRLAAVEPVWFKDFEAKIRALGVAVKSNP